MQGFSKVTIAVVFAGARLRAAVCGAAGRDVAFRIGNQLLAPTVAWSNARLWEQDLTPTYRIFLPLISR